MDSGNNTLEWIPSTRTWQDYGAGQPQKLTLNSTNWGNRTVAVSGVVNGDTIRGWKENTQSQRGQFVHSDTNINTSGNTIADSSYQTGSYWGFVSTTVVSGPTVTWSQTGNTVNTGRNLQFQFTPTALGSYHVIDTANNNHIHYQSTGNFTANQQQTITFKVHTDVGNNPTFQLYNATASTNVGIPYTPASLPIPHVTVSTWGTINNSVTGGEVTIDFNSGGQNHIYYDATNGDEIEISDSLGNQIGTARFDSNWNNQITVSPIFQPNEIGTTKTLKVRIKNTNYGDQTFHDFLLNTTTHTSGSYTSPYQPQFSATFGTPTISTDGQTWSVPVNYTNANSQDLGVHINRSGTSIYLNPSTALTGNGTYTYSTSAHTANVPIHFQNNDILESNDFTDTYTVTGIGGTGSFGSGPYSWTNDLATGGNTVSCQVTASNTTSSGATIYLKIRGTTGSHLDSWVVPANTTTATHTLTYTSASASTFYYIGHSLNGTTEESAHETDPAPTPPTQQPSVSYAPAKGGRKRRFPIISTQLFNRQRSVYSIGTTHHELAPQF